jgi:hypothetical protein
LTYPFQPPFVEFAHTPDSSLWLKAVRVAKLIGQELSKWHTAAGACPKMRGISSNREAMRGGGEIRAWEDERYMAPKEVRRYGLAES